MEYIKRYWHIVASLACVLVLGVAYLMRGSVGSVGPVIYTTERTVITAPPVYSNVLALVDIMVHIEGEVNQPGVYTLPYGSRVNDVLALAGGATEKADLARINLAAFLEDAQQIIIPATGEEVELYFAKAAAASTNNNLVNINTADASQLATLPGVGHVIAGNIIAHRELNGPFNTVEELRNVPRIGAVTLENLRSFITVN